jgi:hypothetical protein
MGVSDEELQERQEYVAELRAKLEEANGTRETQVREKSNEIEAARLDAEAAKLEVQLATAEAANKTVDSGAQPLIDVHNKEVDNAKAAADALVASVNAKSDAAKEAAKTPPTQPTTTTTTDNKNTENKNGGNS